LSRSPGKKGATGYSAIRPEAKDNTIIIQADLNDPEDNQIEVVGAGVTCPYHLVKVPTEGLHGALEFVLEVDGEVLLSETRSFPCPGIESPVLAFWRNTWVSGMLKFNFLS
jgi:hypothetical protein